MIIKNATKIYHDEVFHEQTKNIEIDCHFIHHYTFHGLLLLDSISSIDQFIGILIKSLSPYHLCTCWDLLLKSFVRVINFVLRKESIFQPKYIVINLITLKESSLSYCGIFFGYTLGIGIWFHIVVLLGILCLENKKVQEF